MAKYQIVNESGLQEIHTILAANHRLGGDRFGRAELLAWAGDVERHLTDGQSAYIELRSADAVSGNTETHELSPESIEWAGEDEDEYAGI